MLTALAPPAAHGAQLILNYTYDDGSRLTGVHYSNGNRIDYTYDLADNQTAVSSAYVPPLAGDCNSDGVIDLQDVILSLQVSGGQQPTVLNAAADVNGDGKIGVADTIHVLRSLSQ